MIEEDKTAENVTDKFITDTDLQRLQQAISTGEIVIEVPVKFGILESVTMIPLHVIFPSFSIRKNG